MKRGRRRRLSTAKLINFTEFQLRKLPLQLPTKNSIFSYILLRSWLSYFQAFSYAAFFLASSLLFVSVGTNKFLKHVCLFFSSIAVYKALELSIIFV